MGKYCAVFQQIEGKFEGLEFHHVEGTGVAVDTLSKLNSSKSQAPLDVFVQEIRHPSISQESGEECTTVGPK